MVDGSQEFRSRGPWSVSSATPATPKDVGDCGKRGRCGIAAAYAAPSASVAASSKAILESADMSLYGRRQSGKTDSRCNAFLTVVPRTGKMPCSKPGSLTQGLGVWRRVPGRKPVVAASMFVSGISPPTAAEGGLDNGYGWQVCSEGGPVRGGGTPRRRRDAGPASAQTSPGQAPRYEMHDAHFHLTNYIQEGTDIHDFLKIMGDRVGRVDALRHSRCSRSGRTRTPATSRPTYYLQTDAPLYYYSFTDAYIAMAYKSLSQGGAGAVRSHDHRLQPGRHVRRRPHPPGADDLSRGLLRASASSRIHKEFVSVEDRRRDGQPH